MSIINDAIKKARMEFETKAKRNDSCNAGASTQPYTDQAQIAKSSETRWTIILVISLVLIASLLGSLVFYQHLSKMNALYRPKRQPVKISQKKEPFIPNVNVIERPTFPPLRTESLLELNGIVYGPKDKWAIVNNRIVREGDSVLDGTLMLIAKDFVKVRKNNGEEILLELR